MVAQAHKVAPLFLKARHQRQQVFQGAAEAVEAVEFPHRERVTGAQPGRQELKLRAVFGGRGFFLHEVGAAGGLQGIDL